MSKPKKLEGIVFKKDSETTRSTTAFGKNVWSAAFKSVDDNLSKCAESERNWRFGYAKYVRENVRVSLQSPSNALTSAKQGIEAVYDGLEFIRDSQTFTLREALEKFNNANAFHTGIIQGKQGTTMQERGDGSFVVPYLGKSLRGETLKKQARAWSDYGTIEPSAADALCAISEHKEWFSEKSLSSKVFVLLGAAAAMGPFQTLMDMGATVIALDIGFPGVWRRLISTARGSKGTLIFPLSKPQSECADDEALINAAGCDLAKQTPEVSAWLCNTVPGDKQPIIGSYVYLMGGLFVLVATACDLIMDELCKSRKDTVIAFLCTPTDCHAVPKEAWEAAQRNYAGSWKNLVMKPFEFSPISSLRLRKNMQPPVQQASSSSGGEQQQLYWVNGLVLAQGPNYATSKRLQHWRAMVARENGHIVSSNIAPSTATRSVTQNKSFAWAYDGMPFFEPMEIFQPETSNAVMTALLFNDLFNEKSVANPKNELANPLLLFSENAFHGGAWRIGYTFDSIGGVSVLLHFAKSLPVLLIGLLVIIFFFIRFFL